MNDPSARRVLLVEDEFDTRELLGQAITRAGYICLLAESRERAFQCLEQEPDLSVVITDIVLGDDERGGLDLLLELKRRGLGVPVIVTTAYADVEKLKIALNEGAAYFLEKPFRATELVAAIERALNAERSSISPPKPALDRTAELFARAKLTEKEKTVAHHLLEGKNSSEIAAQLSNSPKTIRQHVSQIYAKCGVSSRAEFFRLVYLR